MTEGRLDRLARARRHHPLAALRQVSHQELDDSTGVPEQPAIVGAALGALVHFSVQRAVATAFG